VVLAFVALAMSLVLSQLSGFLAIFIAAVSFHLATATIMPLTETVAVSGVRRRGLDYGRMRLWGSLSFIVATTAGGALVGAWGPGAGVWLMVAGALATALASLLLPSSEPAGDGTAATTAHPVFLLFLVAVGAVQGAHAMFYTFGALNWASQGVPGLWIGILWGLGVLAEVLLFAWSAAVLRRVGAMPLLIAGCAAAVLRWTAMAFQPPFALLLPLQLLHALTYGATHIAAIHFIGCAVPERAAGTAQSLYATIAAGLAMGGATLFSGALYAGHGSLAYLAMAVISAVGLVAALLLARRWDGGLIRIDTDRA
jgi:PPP family 3-phenylpropionic acid transporter